jgi:hypothetical protein
VLRKTLGALAFAAAIAVSGLPTSAFAASHGHGGGGHAGHAGGAHVARSGGGYHGGGHGGRYYGGGYGGGPIYDSCAGYGYGYGYGPGYGYGGCPGYGVPLVGGLINGALGGYAR